MTKLIHFALFRQRAYDMFGARNAVKTKIVKNLPIYSPLIYSLYIILLC